MPNNLTGDYDVVAAFSLQAVDRILAAMHRGKHLPHSLSMAVDDIPQLRLGVAAVGVIDRYGEAVADRVTIKQVAYARPLSKVVDSDVINRLDPVVNWRAYSKLGLLPDVSLAGSSYLSGVAQLQLGPPTMQLPRGSSGTFAGSSHASLDSLLHRPAYTRVERVYARRHRDFVRRAQRNVSPQERRSS